MNDKHSKIQAQLDAIRVSYIASLKEKRQSILDNWSRLQSNWTTESYDQLYLVIHGLAGSAETFGLPHITQQARDVINQFKAHKSQGVLKHQEFISEVNPALVRLVQLLEQQDKT